MPAHTLVVQSTCKNAFLLPPHLCARRSVLPMSIWKSSWDSLAECKAGERSTSKAKDSILWKMDTILQWKKTCKWKRWAHNNHNDIESV